MLSGLAELLAQPNYYSTLSVLSLIAIPGFYVVLLSFLMYVYFNYFDFVLAFHCFGLPSFEFIKANTQKLKSNINKARKNTNYFNTGLSYYSPILYIS